MATSFLGVGWSFPPAFSTAIGGVQMDSDLDDVKTSLEILLGTALGERFLQPKYGCNLEKLVFDPLSTTMKTYVKGLIEQAILNFEPRIIVNDVVIGGVDTEGIVRIEIRFTVRATNSRYNMVYPFFIGEASRV
jgi:uncharacterized protein